MKKIFFTTATSLFILLKINAQGCSDAGVCTIHSFKNNTEKYDKDDKNNNEIVLGLAFGKGERSTSNFTQYIEYTRSLSYKTSVTGKISFSEISGELANTNGPGDLFVSVNHAFDTKNKWQKSFVVGLKIPFDKADIVEKGIHLPMPYQTSLGTTDLVLGINYGLKSFGATLAVQQPLNPANGNRFLPEEYTSVPKTNKYFPTNKFSRKGDVLLRVSYNYDLNEKFSVRPSLLSIYHEGNDTYLDASKIRREIPKSSGLTMNGNVFVDYRLTKTSSFELSLGAPFIIRSQPAGWIDPFICDIAGI